MKILIVDQSKFILGKLEEMLQSMYPQMNIFTASTVEEGAELFQAHLHPVVVIDMNLDNSSSFNFLKQIKETCHQCAIVAMSIYNDDLFVKNVMNAKADYFVDKYEAADNIPAVINKIEADLVKKNPLVAKIIEN